jgi:hypothetical protein
MKRFTAAALGVSLFAACAHSPPEEDIPVVHCIDGVNCDRVWSEAQAWVIANSTWKLRIVNDTLITTEGPLQTTSAAFTIMKRPERDGVYRIDFQAACGNPFGCVPTVGQLHADFAAALRRVK